MKKPQKTYFTLGLVGSPFGLKGFVKVKSLSGETGHFIKLKEVTLRKGEKEESFKVEEILTEEENRNSSLLMRFAGIDNPEVAKRLTGAEIITGREYAAPLKEGEYYVEDLKGLEVVSKNGEPLGEIIDIIEGGGGNLAELKLMSGAVKLAPFRKEFFGVVDLKEGKVELIEPWVLV